jgi:hypothetical protein
MSSIVTRWSKTYSFLYSLHFSQSTDIFVYLFSYGLFKNVFRSDHIALNGRMMSNLHGRNWGRPRNIFSCSVCNRNNFHRKHDGVYRNWSLPVQMQLSVLIYAFIFRVISLTAHCLTTKQFNAWLLSNLLNKMLGVLIFSSCSVCALINIIYLSEFCSRAHLSLHCMIKGGKPWYKYCSFLFAEETYMLHAMLLFLLFLRFIFSCNVGIEMNNWMVKLSATVCLIKRSSFKTTSLL